MRTDRFDRDGKELKGIKGLFSRAFSVITNIVVQNAMVLNNSNGDGIRQATDAEVKEAGETMAREIEATWSTAETKRDNRGRQVSVNVKFDGGVKVIHNVREAQGSYYLFKIVPNGLEVAGNRDVLGQAPMGGNWMEVVFSESYLQAIMNRNDIGESDPVGPIMNKTASHEFGHSGNLPDRGWGKSGIMMDIGYPPSFKDFWNLFRRR